ncbi:hypothetical protein YC2023_043194 [Brassica napus]
MSQYLETKSTSPKSQTHVQSSLLAEGLSIYATLSHAFHLGYNKIWLRSDFLSLIIAINLIIRPKNLHGVHSDIENLSSSLRTREFQSYRDIKYCCLARPMIIRLYIQSSNFHGSQKSSSLILPLPLSRHLYQPHFFTSYLSLSTTSIIVRCQQKFIMILIDDSDQTGIG